MTEMKNNSAEKGISIVVTGDICPINRAEKAILEGEGETLFGEYLDELRKADLTIGNLETPLTRGGHPIVKSGPNLRAVPECAAFLKAAGLDVVGLANNHILDYGAEGLADTIRACEAAGLDVTGGGPDAASAGRMLIRNVKGIRVGILAVAEEEWSLATDRSPGAASMDPLNVIPVLEENRGKFDFGILLFHGGIEHYPYSSPEIRKYCRFMAEHGMNIVVCQHSHCIGQHEIYKGNHIFYGQGNFLFDLGLNKTHPTWHHGFLLKIQLTPGSESEISQLFYRQMDSLGKITPVFCADLSPEEQALTEPVSEKEDEVMLRKWQEFALSREFYYEPFFLGLGRYASAFYRKFKLIHYFHRRRQFISLFHVIRCSSHYEVIRSFLEQKSKG